MRGVGSEIVGDALVAQRIVGSRGRARGGASAPATLIQENRFPPRLEIREPPRLAGLDRGQRRGVTNAVQGVVQLRLLRVELLQREREGDADIDDRAGLAVDE